MQGATARSSSEHVSDLEQPNSTVQLVNYAAGGGEGDLSTTRNTLQYVLPLRLLARRTHQYDADQRYVLHDPCH